MCKRRSRMMGNYHVRFRGRGRGSSHREPSPLPDGVEDFQEIKIRHSKYAASRFAHEAAPALTRFANSSPEGIFDFVQGSPRLARDKTQQDARLDMEGRAKKLLDRVG